MRRAVGLAVAGCLLMGGAAGAAGELNPWATPVGIERVSVSTSGSPGNHDSIDPDSSDDGRFVTYYSLANNLVPGDTNGEADVFVRDRTANVTERVSVRSDGTEAHGGSSAWPSISGNGRFVAFVSTATDLVPGDTNGWLDVFVHDRLTGETRRVSVSSSGVQANERSTRPSISGDGRFTVFSSDASNLVDGDTNFQEDVFVYDWVTGATSRVSVGHDGSQLSSASYVPDISGDGHFVAYFSGGQVVVADLRSNSRTIESVNLDGTPGGWLSIEPSLSYDGRFVSFTSSAGGLVTGDTNQTLDVFVRDRSAGVTTRVSVSSSGAEGVGGYADRPSISGDGRYVAFFSTFTNLVEGDTNGAADVFVHDTVTHVTSRISALPDGTQSNGYSDYPSFAADGSSVSFWSEGSTLSSGDTNGRADVFVTAVSQRIYTITGDGFLGGNVEQAPAVNVGRAGRTYRLAWQLTDRTGAYVSDLAAVNDATYARVDCSSMTGTTNDVVAEPTGGSGLRYNTTDQLYEYNWKTPSTPGCYRFTIRLRDGATLSALFRLL